MAFRLNPSVYAAQGASAAQLYQQGNAERRADRRLDLDAEAQQFRHGAQQIARQDQRNQFQAGLEMQGRAQKLQVEGEQYRQGKTDDRQKRQLEFSGAEGARGRLHQESMQNTADIRANQRSERSDDRADERFERGVEATLDRDKRSFEHQLDRDAKNNAARLRETAWSTFKALGKTFIENNFKTKGDLAKMDRQWQQKVYSDVLEEMMKSGVAPKHVTMQGQKVILGEMVKDASMPIYTAEQMAEPMSQMMITAAISAGQAMTVPDAAASLESHGISTDGMDEQQIITNYRSFMQRGIELQAKRVDQLLGEHKNEAGVTLGILRTVAGNNPTLLNMTDNLAGIWEVGADQGGGQPESQPVQQQPQSQGQPQWPEIQTTGFRNNRYPSPPPPPPR